METWVFSDENLHLLNSIIEKSQQNCPQNEIQNHLQTLFRNNLNSPGNINDTTNFTTTVINISSDEEKEEEKMNGNEVKVEVVEERRVIENSDDFKFLLNRNENGLLTENTFLQIIKSNKMDKVFMFLEQNFSSEELCKFCMFLASLKNIENDILKSFCTIILCPRFMNSSINTSLQNSIQKLFINFENILCENLLIKLMEQKLNQNLQVLVVICNQLTTNNKYTVLSKLLNSSEQQFDEERIELVHTLFENDTADENLKLRIIHLLYDCADLFSKSLIYGKLLLTILKSIKAAELSDTQISLLESIVAQNKSIYKRAAEKMIKNVNK